MVGSNDSSVEVMNEWDSANTKVSIQGVVVLGGHFVTLCQEVDLYEAFFFSLLIFKKKSQIVLNF